MVTKKSLFIAVAFVGLSASPWIEVSASPWGSSFIDSSFSFNGWSREDICKSFPGGEGEQACVYLMALEGGDCRRVALELREMFVVHRKLRNLGDTNVLELKNWEVLSRAVGIIGKQPVKNRACRIVFIIDAWNAFHPSPAIQEPTDGDGIYYIGALSWLYKKLGEIKTDSLTVEMNSFLEKYKENKFDCFRKYSKKAKEKALNKDDEDMNFGEATLGMFSCMRAMDPALQDNSGTTVVMGAGESIEILSQDGEQKDVKIFSDVFSGCFGIGCYVLYRDGSQKAFLIHAAPIDIHGRVSNQISSLSRELNLESYCNPIEKVVAIILSQVECEQNLETCYFEAFPSQDCFKVKHLVETIRQNISDPDIKYEQYGEEDDENSIGENHEFEIVLSPNPEESYFQTKATGHKKQFFIERERERGFRKKAKAILSRILSELSCNR